MTLLAGTRLGPYGILAPIGAGGMGEVYRARDDRLDREVAVKVLPEKLAEDSIALSRFEHEAKALAALSHPNLVGIFDFGREGKVVYAVMELLEGETLRHRLVRAAISWHESLEIAVPIAQGLAAAHSRDIVHRDLKPENVFLTSDGRVKILDFGLARREVPSSVDPSDSPTQTLNTRPGAVMGTVGYMSPEQVLGEVADQRSDIFSFGAILYEMFVGKRAFQGVSPAETMSSILRDRPSALRGVDPRLPQSLLPIIARCLEKKRENRFDSIRDVAFFLSGYSPSADDEGAPSTGESELATAAVRSQASLRFSRLTFRRGLILAARFGADGQTIYYGAAWDGKPFQCFSTRGDSSESAALAIPDASLLAVSSTGEMAVLLGLRAGSPTHFSGTLGRVSVVGGTPRELAEGVKWADWSPDGKELAIVRRVGSRERLEYPIGNVLYETRGWISNPRVAPAGGQVAFIQNDRGGYVKSALWTIDRGGECESISSGWAGAYSLAWSPSGEEIWFTASKSSEGAALHAVSLAGTERLLYRAPELLRVLDVFQDGRALLTTDDSGVGILAKVRGEKQERNLSWLSTSSLCDLSDDGSLLLFNARPEYAGGARPGIYVRRTDGSPAVRLGDGLALGFSPDQKWVLSISLPGPPAIVLLPVGAGEARTVSLAGVVPESAVWFPDGRRLLVQGREPGGDARLYVQDLQGGSFTSVSPQGVRLSGSAVVSPDGRVAIARGADGAVGLYDLDGGREEVIRGLVQGERVVCWTADGGGLYVFRIGEIPCSVFRLDPTTGQRELWRKLVPPDPAGIVSVQTLCIASDSKSYAYSFWSDYSDLYLVDGLR